MRTAFSLIGNGSFLLLVITITFIRQPHDHASEAHLEKKLYDFDPTYQVILLFRELDII